MRQNFSPINTAPVESMVGKLVKLAPGQFLGEEIIDPGLFQDLG